MFFADLWDEVYLGAWHLAVFIAFFSFLGH